MLELGVVGTPKELWARLNEDGGLPAATLLRLACHFEGLHAEAGERSRAILELLKPGLLQSLDIDDPRRASQSAKAIAERRGRNKSIAKVQNLFRVTDQQHADGLPHCMLMVSLIRSRISSGFLAA